MEKRLVEAGLVLLCNYEHVEVVMELSLGLCLAYVCSVLADVDARLCPFLLAILDGTREGGQYLYVWVVVLLDVALHLVVVADGGKA